MTSHIRPGETPPTPGPPPPSPPTPAAPKRRRRRWLLAALVLILLAGAAVGGWWWFRPLPPPDPPMPPDIVEPEVRQVIETARQRVLKNPRSADAWGLLGMTLVAHLFDREADRCFAEASRLDPSDARWPYARGLMALKRDPDHALAYLRQAADLEKSPDDRASMRVQLAESLLERGQVDEAEGLFKEELSRKPDDARAAYGLGLIALAGNNPTAAEQYLTAARASPYAKKKATAELAKLARARGDDAAAAVYDRESADLPDDPPWPDPLLDRTLELQVGHRRREREVIELERAQRFQEAAEIYLRQIEEDPGAASAYTKAGIDLFRLGQYDRAFGLLREGVKRDPDSSDAHFGLALALFTRAEKEWQQSPGDERLKGLFREAAEHAQKATELKPDFAKAYLFWGLSLKYLGDPAAAVAPLRKGVACRPEEIELQLGLGEALVESGEGKEARTYLENARRLDPNDPRPPRDLERLHQKSGK
jgi:tetratricopeptide (TPR) repeat protein